MDTQINRFIDTPDSYFDDLDTSKDTSNNISNDNTPMESNGNCLSQSKYYAKPTENERCKARSKQSGERCKRWAASGFDVCAFHGAGGKGSKNRLKKAIKNSNETLDQALDRIKNDPELLSLKQDITDLRLIKEQLKKDIDLNNLTDPENMSKVTRLIKDISDAIKSFSYVEKNLNKSINDQQIKSISMQYQDAAINSLRHMNLSKEDQDKFISFFLDQLEHIKFIDTE